MLCQMPMNLSPTVGSSALPLGALNGKVKAVDANLTSATIEVRQFFGQLLELFLRGHQIRLEVRAPINVSMNEYVRGDARLSRNINSAGRGKVHSEANP